MSSKATAKEYRCFVCDARSQERGIPLLVGETTFSRICLGEKLQEILGDKYIVLVKRNDCVCWKCATYINSFDRHEHNNEVIRDLMASQIGNKYKDAKMAMDDLLNKDSEKSDPPLADEFPDSIPQVAKRGRKAKRPVGRPSKKPKIQPNLPGAIIKVFSCKFCSKKYDTEAEMKVHITERHTTTYICHICDISFNNLRKYKTHLKTHVIPRNKTHNCVSCGFTSKNIETYCRHVCNSNVVSLTCGTCRKLFVEARKPGKPPSSDCPDCSKEKQSFVNASTSRNATSSDNTTEEESTEPKKKIVSNEELTNQEETFQAPSPVVSPADKEPSAHVLSENSSDTAVNHLSPQFAPSETDQHLETDQHMVLMKSSEEGEDMINLKTGSVSGDGNVPSDDPNHLPETESRKDGENSLMDTNDDTMLKSWDSNSLNPQQVNSGEEDSNDRTCTEDGEIVSSNENALIQNMYESTTLSDYPIDAYVKCSGCQEEFEIGAIPTHTCFLEHDVLEYSEVDPPSYLQTRMMEMSAKNENEDSSMSCEKAEIYEEDMGATFYIKEPGAVFVQEGFETTEQPTPRRRRRIPKIPALENSVIKTDPNPKLQCKTCGLEFTSSSTLREHWDVTGHLREVNLGKHPEVNTFTDKVKKMEMTFKVVKQNFNIKATIPGNSEYVLHGKDEYFKSMFVRSDDGKPAFSQPVRDSKECSTCCVIFPSVQEMVTHQKTECLTCITCEITFLDNKLLKKHYQYTGHSAKRIWRNQDVNHVEPSMEMDEVEGVPEDIIVEEGVVEDEDDDVKDSIIQIDSTAEI